MWRRGLAGFDLSNGFSFCVPGNSEKVFGKVDFQDMCFVRVCLSDVESMSTRTISGLEGQ